MIVYLFLLLAGVITIWWFFTHSSVVTRKWILGAVAIVSIFIVMLLLLRVSPYAAGIVGGLTTLYVLFSRVLSAWSFFRWVQRLCHKNPTAPPPPSTPIQDTMSLTEAADILGVSVDATKQEIRKAYKHLMKKNHPDHGGTTKLAEQINIAKDVMLKHIDIHSELH